MIASPIRHKKKYKLQLSFMVFYKASDPFKTDGIDEIF